VSHVSKSLAAYQDGELDRRAVQAVEAHLSRCEACRAELASLADLSALLHEPDPAPLSVSDAVFAAQVTLQLPREETETLSERTLAWGLRLAPVGIVATWAFGQTATILALLIRSLIAVGVDSPALLALAASDRPLLGFGPGLAGSLVGSAGLGHVWGSVQPVIASAWAVLGPVIFSGVTAVAILSWVAIWWTGHRLSPVRGRQIGRAPRAAFDNTRR